MKSGRIDRAGTLRKLEIERRRRSRGRRSQASHRAHWRVSASRPARSLNRVGRHPRKTAKTLGLKVPTPILLRTDKVIEWRFPTWSRQVPIHICADCCDAQSVSEMGHSLPK
jgi:hypothetical protein